MKVAALLLTLSAVAYASDNGLARLPPLGWNTWCTQGKCALDVCNEEEIRSIADAMVENGMRDLGYQYVNLDDCWADHRDAEGTIVEDKRRFPSGMKALADYIHERGMRFGLYTDSGLYTCSSGTRPYKIPGSYGHYEQDANTYAEWGVDFVKMDWCNTKLENGTQLDPRQVYPEMSRALNATGRPILFNSCEWGVDNPWEWAGKWMNMWRTGADHHDSWASTASVIEASANLGKYAGPGGWNDPDFIFTGGEGCSSVKLGPVGEHCPGQTDTEYQTEIALWTIMAAPLLVATDIRNMTAIMQSLLLNNELLNISQDRLGLAGGRTAYDHSCANATHCQIWSRPLDRNRVALALYNAGEESTAIRASLSLVGLKSAFARNVFTRSDIGTVHDSISATVAPHGTFLVTLQPIE